MVDYDVVLINHCLRCGAGLWLLIYVCLLTIDYDVVLAYGCLFMFVGLCLLIYG